MIAAELFSQMRRLQLTEAELMHYLTEAGLISDNCIRLWDIAEPDMTRAVNWLNTKRVKWGSETDINEKVLV
jgi:hypothetical protein